jgi:hypothetical protein
MTDTRPWCWREFENTEVFEPAESREDAVKRAVEFWMDRHVMDQKVFTWQRVQASVEIGRLDVYAPYLFGDQIVDLLRQQADDDVGEVVEDWPDASVDDVARLGKDIERVIHAWLVRTGNLPTFGTVSDVQAPTEDEVRTAITAYTTRANAAADAKETP